MYNVIKIVTVVMRYDDNGMEADRHSINRFISAEALGRCESRVAKTFLAWAMEADAREVIDHIMLTTSPEPSGDPPQPQQ